MVFIFIKETSVLGIVYEKYTTFRFASKIGFLKIYKTLQKVENAGNKLVLLLLDLGGTFSWTCQV